MKPFAKYISLVLTAAAAGVALFALANASFTSAFSGDIVVPIIASAVIVGFAAYDYSRRARSLTGAGRVLRPSLPLAVKTPQTTAYGVKSTRANRLAA